MKILLIVTALFEGLVGVGLFLMPVLVVSTLLNTPLDTPGGLVAARLAGAAIIALAICCWQARDSQLTQAALGIVAALLFYNIAAAGVLAYGGVRLGLQSVFIWPTIVVHSALAIWCAALVWLAFRKEQSATMK